MATKKSTAKENKVCLRECSFNPNEHTVDIINSFTNQPEKYLPVNRRVEWYLTYCKENGIIPYISVKHEFNERTWQYVATVEIYMDEKLVAIDVGAKVYNPKSPETYSALMSAVTAAKGRALANCGFGTCLTGVEETDKIPVDAGVPINNDVKPIVESDNIEDLPFNEQVAMADYFEDIEPEDEFPIMEMPAAPAPPAPVKKSMTLDEARAFVCPCGSHNGETLGVIAATDPNMIKFFAEKYSRPGYEDLVTAAKIIAADILS